MSERILKAALMPDIMSGKNLLQAVCFYPIETCNLKCSWCNAYDRIADRIPYEKAVKFFEDAKTIGLKTVNFSGGGEPYLHPDIERMIRFAQEIGYETSSITNGTLLHKFPIDIFEKMVWMRISVNAGPRLYKKVHGVKLYDIVMNNVNKMGDLKNVKVGVNCVWDKNSELNDIEDLMKDVSQTKVAYFRIAAERHTLNGVPSAEIPFKDIIAKAPNNLKLELDYERDGRAPKICKTQWLKPVIDSDGFVYACCLNRKPLCKIEDICEFWSKKVDTVDSSKCSWCLYGDLNNFLNELDDTRTRKDLNFL